MESNRTSEKHMMSDYLISIPLEYSISQIIEYLKGKSAMMIFERHSNLKYKFGNKHWN